MKRAFAKRRRLAFIGLLTLGMSLAMAGRLHADDLGDQIAALVNGADLGKMKVGIRVERISPKREAIFDLNGDLPLKPASNQKLITTATALDVLPADFTYRTLLGRRGEDLIIIGAGDPSVGDAKMAEDDSESVTQIFDSWAAALKAKGQTQFTGDLLFDDFIFDAQYLHPRWRELFNLQTWWAAPIGGLNFNDNCIDVIIQRGEKTGTAAVVQVIPETPWVQVKNTAITSRSGSPIVRRLGEGPLTITVSGPVSASNSAKSPLSIAVTDPGMFFATAARAALERHGIQIAGQTRRVRIRTDAGVLPADFQLLGVYERKLADVLWRINKSSQNMCAEGLFKTLGAYAGRLDHPGLGSNETARAVVGSFLAKIGAKSEGCVIDDGSGLSYDNRATAANFVTVLRYMADHPRAEDFYTNLAVPGEKSGTLRNRMKDLRNVVRAKTGHIKEVSALSGYVVAADSSRYAFSVLCNDTSRAGSAKMNAHGLQEAMCRKLAAWPQTQPVAKSRPAPSTTRSSTVPSKSTTGSNPALQKVSTKSTTAKSRSGRR